MRLDIMQDGQLVASVQGPDADSVMADAMHYALMYGQDGPVEIKGVTTEMWTALVAPTTDREE